MQTKNRLANRSPIVVEEYGLRAVAEMTPDGKARKFVVDIGYESADGWHPYDFDVTDDGDHLLEAVRFLLGLVAERNHPVA